MTMAAPIAIIAKAVDRARLAQVADWLAVAVAVSLPWSTSATSVLIAIWLLALAPTITLAELRRELARPQSGLPFLLWGLGIVGMLWSDASLAERLDAMRGLHKLLVIPLLFIQFRRSDKGHFVLGGFVVSGAVLLVLSWSMYLFKPPPWRMGVPGLPVKDYIVQSAEFLLCAFACSHLAITAWNNGRRRWALAFTALAVAFLGNIAFVVTARTSLVTFPVLLLLFGAQRFGAKGTLALALGGVLFAGAIWASSPYLRERTFSVVDELQRYHSQSAETSAGYRLEFWKKSITFVAEAPVFGHGTGSIPVLFRAAASQDSRIAAAVTGNPHNQTLEIAIQFGLIGAVFLFAMWIAHVLVFDSSAGLSAWLGQALVIQTVIGSLFLSYLFDFSTGWIYVFGVGVLGALAVKGAASGGDNAGKPHRNRR